MVILVKISKIVKFIMIIILFYFLLTIFLFVYCPTVAFATGPEEFIDHYGNVEYVGRDPYGYYHDPAITKKGENTMGTSIDLMKKIDMKVKNYLLICLEIIMVIPIILIACMTNFVLNYIDIVEKNIHLNINLLLSLNLHEILVIVCVKKLKGFLLVKNNNNSFIIKFYLVTITSIILYIYIMIYDTKQI